MKKQNVLLIGSIAVVCCLTLFGCSMNKMRTALESKNMQEISEVYNEAIKNEKLLDKYDEEISMYIQEIVEDLNEYDFDKTAIEMGDGAVYEYSENKWNDLMLPDSDNSLIVVIDNNTQEQWDLLQEIYKSKKYYCQALYEYRVKSKYQYAIESFQLISENDTKYNEVDNLIDECVSAYVDSFAIVINDNTTEEEIKGVLEQLNEAAEFLNQCGISESGIQEKELSCLDSYINTVLKNVNSDIENGDINVGLQHLQSAEEYLNGKNLISEEINKKMEEVMIVYAEEYATRAEAALKDHDVDAALGNIEVAIDLQPDNADYLNLKETFKQYLPYALYDEDNLVQGKLIKDKTQMISTISDYDFCASIKGNDNKDYMNIIEIGNGAYSFHELVELSYNLSGKYDMVNGKILISQIDKNYDQSTYFEAYGDGKLLFTSPTMQPGILPQDISFNVSGVQKLELKFYGNTTSMWEPGIALSNLIAQKNFPE